ncbi:TPA: hypothetical protein L0X66_001792 [Citrobacter freundii]|nr:hypothetical protein [Citrobacter freundii]
MKLKAIILALLVTSPAAFGVTLECDAFVIKTVNDEFKDMIEQTKGTIENAPKEFSYKISDYGNGSSGKLTMLEGKEIREYSVREAIYYKKSFMRETDSDTGVPEFTVFKTENIKGEKSEEGQAYIFSNCEIK